MELVKGALKYLGYAIAALCLVVIIPLAILMGMIGWLVRLYKDEHYSDIDQVYEVLSTAHPDKLTGYEISRRVNNLRGNHWWSYLGTGHLYPALEKLLKARKVERVAGHCWIARR